MAKKILLLNGPNLNMLGKRDPKLYGDITLKDVEETCEKLAKQNGIQLESKQTNYEGELVEFLSLIHIPSPRDDVISRMPSSA